MDIIEDSNQKLGMHDAKNAWWSEHGVRVERSRLPFGDYVRMPNVSVDTKRDIYELCMDIDQEHDRFRAECVKARDFGARLVILVENEDGVTDLASLCDWEESDDHFSMRKAGLVKRGKNPSKSRRISGERMAKACATMQKKYGVEFQFCTPQEAAAAVIEILEGVR